MSKHVLGVSAYYHDSAAALVRDGEIVAAAQEERFTRIKHDRNFPVNAARYCLKEAGISTKDLDLVVYYDKPLLTFDRLLETYLAYAPAGFKSFCMAIPVWMHEKLYLPREIDRALGGEYEGRIMFNLHHVAHAASAFYPSPFESAAILTMDGVGEWSTATIGVGRGGSIKLLKEIRFPHSLGLLYSAFTYYLGFKVNSGEYKVMGLAPYGEPSYEARILKLVDAREDGSIHMDMRYFNFCDGLTMTNRAFADLFEGPVRKPEDKLEQRHMDIAASIQKVCGDVMLRMARHARKLAGEENLCMAGGVALNCVGNGLILHEGVFKRLWIQPASGDAGGALGSALFGAHELLGVERKPNPRDSMKGALLGPRFSREEILAALKGADHGGLVYRELPEAELFEEVVGHLIDGKVIGLLQGRMEFGPRALGSRTIIGDARHPEMQSRMNVRIKFREGFRPFAPAALAEDSEEYFDLKGVESPYMLLVGPVTEKQRKPLPPEAASAKGTAKLKILRSTIPAVTHVDYSARVQTVAQDTNPYFYRLIKAFKARTGCSTIVNTSFNVRGEPIVCAPAEAIRCFLNTDMDALVLENFILLKSEQKAKTDQAGYLKQFAPD